jgi:hypothetical protein
MSGPREAGGESQIHARLAITELLYRYAELIDAGDFDGVGQLLSRATFAGTASLSRSGAGTLAKLFASTTRRYPEHGNTPRTRHLVLNPDHRDLFKPDCHRPLDVLRRAGHRDVAATADRRRTLS